MSELIQTLLGALVLSPNLLQSTDLTADNFPPGNERRVFEAIASMWEEEQPIEIDPVILAERVGGNGAGTFVGSLLNGSIRLEPAQFRRRVTELRRKTLTVTIESILARQARSEELDLAEILPLLDEYKALEGRALDLSRILISGTDLQSLDLKVEYAIDKLAPCRSLTLIHGPGGLAKTWLALCMAKAVSEGLPFLGLQTRQRPVTYIDYENPLPMLVERVRKLAIGPALFWHLSADPRPPKLDSGDWVLFKNLPRGLLVFDTARSSFDGDENSSQDVGLVMNRLKELRELGNEIILLHHTPRANDRTSKGSTAWEDLADHVLAFYKVKKETLEETDEEINYDPSALLSLGTVRKTRYKAFRIYLTLDPNGGGFFLSESPEAAALDAVRKYIQEEGAGRNQGEIFDWAKEAGIGPKKRASFIALLNRGEQERLWITRKGLKGAKHYEPAT